MAKATHLIGAHGMFWERDAVDWEAGRGQTFQLLGYRGHRSPKLEVCDFRRTRGIYILFDNFRPTYVGRARGNEGLGSRLHKHHKDPKKGNWLRFCWFAFDSIVPIRNDPYWRTVQRDEGSRAIGADPAIDELEALMITAFGLHGTQNTMKLATAREPWKQLTPEECLPSGIAHKFDGPRVRMRSLRDMLDWEDD